MLAIVGDGEVGASGFQGLFGQVGQEPLPQGVRSGMHHPGRKVEVFLGGNPKHIFNEPGVEGACPLAWGQELLHIEKKNPGLFTGNDIADEVFAGDRRIVFSKDLSAGDVAKDIAVSPIKIHHDIDAAGFHKANLAD